MATRKIKDAQDTTTNELIYFKGHAKATYMSDGRNVEEAIHQIGTGEGGGGITVETDPIFSASPAAAITEDKIAEWDNKYTKPSGGIPQSDLAEEVKDALRNGVGIASVKQTTTSTADGGTNVVTVTLSNGTTSTFNVKNGSKGSSGTNGTNGKDGADGEDGVTFTPSVDSAGNLSWTNNGGLTNPPTVNIKGPKGDKGDAGEGGGGSGGPTIVEIDAIDYNFIDLTDNTIYLFYGQLSNLEVVPSMPLTKGCLLRFETDIDCTLIIPDCHWANGATPSIEGNTCYELSLTDNQDGYIFAVLTPFKSV